MWAKVPVHVGIGADLMHLACGHLEYGEVKVLVPISHALGGIEQAIALRLSGRRSRPALACC